MSEQIRREFTLSYPIEKVKQAIVDTCRTSPGGRQLKDHNAAFNSYSVTLVRNLYVLPTTITLKVISENETHFELSAIPGPHLTRMVQFTSSMIEDFLKQIGGFASGQLIVQQPTAGAPPTQKVSTGKALIFFIICIAFAAAIVYFASKL